MKNYLLVFSFILAFYSSSLGQPFDKAIVLGGDSSYVEIPAHDSLHSTSNLSLEAWIKPCSIVGREIVFSKIWCFGNQNSYYLDIFNGHLRWVWFSANCGVTSGGNRYETNVAVIQPNTWQHIAVVHTPNEVKIFVNGLQVAASLTLGSFGNLRPSTEPLRLGAYKDYSGALALLYTGQMDEVRVWNDSLTNAEILSRYNTPLLGNEAHLMGYYPFDQPTLGPNQPVLNHGVILDSLCDVETKGSSSYQTPFYVDAYTAYLLPEDTVYCASDTIAEVLNVSVPNGTYSWENGSANFSRQIATTGDFQVTVSNACFVVQDTFRVSQLAPLSVNLGGDTNLCGVPSYTLDASNAGASFLWSDGSSDSLLTVSYSGSYVVTVSNTCESVVDAILLDGLLYVDSISGCDSVLSPSGNSWWVTSGVYNDTITNLGCDSVIEMHVSLNTSSFAATVELACDSFVSYSGLHTWYTSGQYFDTLINQAGCDSIITINLTVHQSSMNVLTPVVCDSFVAPDGQVYTTSGVYSATLTNSLGCDSVITIQLTVNAANYVTVYEVACDSFAAPNGQVYTSSGVYTAHLQNTFGCDSIVTINLTINAANTTSITEFACDQYTAPDGQVYSTSGVYQAHLQNALGCDSLVTINLTINTTSSATLTAIACDSYTAPDGQVYTSSGVYSAVIPNSMGCDSMITINLTVNSSSTSSITTTSCGPYMAPDGTIYSVTGNYTVVIPNANGCDSIIALDLTVTQIDTLLTVNGNIIDAVDDPSYSYQWVDCDLNLAIPGETNSLMMVTESGNYKVIISTSNCVDTSGCVNVIVANTLELNNYNIRLYPNPAKQFVTLSGDLTPVKVDVFDLNGKRVHTGIKQSERYTVPVANWPRGLYLFRTTYRGTIQTAKISLE